MRLFIAIEIPKEIRNEIVTFYPLFKQYFNGNFVEEEKLHVTVIFIGDKIEDINLIKSKMEGYKGTIVLNGIDFFFSNGFPRVAFINAIGAESIAKELYNALGIKPEEEIHLHLTVCRIKNVFKDINELKQKFNYNKEVQFDHLTLFNSDYKHYYKL